MAFDFALDRKTGDWLFSGNRDVKQVSGDALIAQRIRIRTVIPRGTFLYDLEKTLGSRLYEALRMPVSRAVVEASAIIDEALDPMKDIAITSITITENENLVGQFQANVKWRPITNFGDDLLTGTDTGSLTQTSIPLPASLFNFGED